MARNHTSHISYLNLFLLVSRYLSLSFFFYRSKSDLISFLILWISIFLNHHHHNHPFIFAVPASQPPPHDRSFAVQASPPPHNHGSKARQVWRLEEEDDGFRFRKRKLTASW
ncbi:hypothetical protein IGI04_012476 [Brassica rapa subsp. trilocularis]|uniref:Transmembrane protein n=1 Tax=Brassica rapa subsp. trilocularis TaxID=1813537 RepID=A0ABQ7N634_BRACM|nr:hypothetical protein IGI04_012476 [Brassica rapa subsp. trilocularis]